MRQNKGISRDLNELMQFPEEGIFSTIIEKSDNHHSTLMCLASGTDIDEHTSTKTGFILVLKGKGKFILYDKEIEMKPGVFIYMPKNAPHSLSAEEDLAMMLILAN